MLAIDEPELKKPAAQWCPHCRPGRGGCSIYEARPPICRGYMCNWLVNPKLGDEWRPTRAKMFMHFRPTMGECSSGQVLSIMVDPASPNRWREPPYYAHIKRFAVQGVGNGFAVRVLVGRRQWVITPDADVEITGKAFLSVDTPLGRVVLTFDDETERRCYIDLIDSALTPERQLAVVRVLMARAGRDGAAAS